MRSLSHKLLPVLALLVGVSCKDDPMPTAPDNLNAAPELAATAAELSFYQISSGIVHSCGVTADSRLYCWGGNYTGQVGDGTTTHRTTPVPIAPELRFRIVSTGYASTCAITTEYQTYCWGYNGHGQLGDGTYTTRSSPTLVAGGLQFRLVDIYENHTCAVALADNRAYCWGFNGYGALGDGTITGTRPTPAPVTGALRFHQVSIGRYHSCGVATDNRAYCWGYNEKGQLGDRTEVEYRNRPTAVADGHFFRQLDAGYEHTCGVRTDKRAFCWGNGRNGQIGNGQAYLSFWPRPVSGGLLFDRVTSNDRHTCGETTGNRGYCWGHNQTGQLGDGTTQQRLTPVAVSGGLFFSQMSAGGHTCARTETGKGYCWGPNTTGELGDGTTEHRFTPTPVVGPSS